MSEYSQIINSFERTGNFPLEADYIFDNKKALLDYYADPVKKATMHKGLLRVVQEEDTQWFYWVVEQDGDLVWQKYRAVAQLEQDVTATNVTVGNIKDGDTLPEGMSFTQFVIKMLIIPKKPTYTISSITDLASPIEIGTPVNDAIGTFVINQGGPINTANATISGFLDANPNPPTVAFTGGKVTISFTGRIAQGNNTVSSTVSYDQGKIFPEITAGTLTASRTIVGQRRFFFGQGTAPNTSDVIRGNVSTLQAGSYSYNLDAGNTAMWIAIPTTNKITQVTDAGALNAVITDNFKASGTVSVDGATKGKDATNYTIYQLTGYGPFGSAHTMNIKFS